MPYLGSTPNASFSSRTKQDFTANGSTTAFTLSSAVASANDIEVFVGNVRQEPTDAYTVNATTLTMSEAPATGLNFYVIFKGVEENSVVPADGTISSAKLTSTALDPITLDSSNNKVGIGTSSPSKTLHVSLQSGSGATPTSNSVAVIDGNDNTELSILGGSSSVLGINFGHSGDNDMARIDYNTTPGNEEMRFRVNGSGSDSMVLRPDGEINMSLQPCFSATATTTNIPLTTQTTITLSSERFDVGGNLANNTFTAPIGGKYLFTFMFYFSNLDNGHTTLDTHIKTSNKQYQMTWRPSVFMNSDGNFSASGSVIADMDKNDTCYFTTYVSGGSAQTDIHGDSQVSGCLLF